jgi:outer membrane lipoprotein-sorting protein
MHRAKKLVFAASIALALLAVRTAMAAPPDEKEKVLRKLDAAAANFHSTSADFEFDSVQTDPLPETDKQKGTVYYERKGNAFQMGVHIREENGKPVPKVVLVSGGTVKLYEKLIDQVTTLSKLGQYQSWFMLGFGASGKDLEQKWEIKYLGPETLNGVKTEKLEMIPKDPAVRKNLPKVTVWMDTERAVSLKQVFDEGPGQYRVCVYFNINTKQPLPADAFTFKTDSKTQYVNK